MSKLRASLSLDLDNRWSYMKTHGDAGWEEYPSYFDLVVPRFLEMLERLGLNMTVFIVGQDAERAENAAALASIAAAGHEIGNHSFNHEPWLHLYDDQQLAEEIDRTDRAIESVCGVRPRGFRGPGFSFSPQLLAILMRRGYRYDASTFPTFLGPLARAYYFFTAKLTREQRSDRKALFGSMSEGFRPLKPYAWTHGEQRMVEIPVTTMPIVRAPFHLSYILYLASYSRFAAIAYLRLAITLCRLTGTEPSFLLHPLDFLGNDDNVGLSFFPAMNMPAKYKCEIAEISLRMLAANFEVGTMQEHAEIAARRKLREHPLAIAGTAGNAGEADAVRIVSQARDG